MDNKFIDLVLRIKEEIMEINAKIEKLDKEIRKGQYTLTTAQDVALLEGYKMQVKELELIIRYSKGIDKDYK